MSSNFEAIVADLVIERCKLLQSDANGQVVLHGGRGVGAVMAAHRRQQLTQTEAV